MAERRPGFLQVDHFPWDAIDLSVRGNALVHSEDETLGQRDSKVVISAWKHISMQHVENNIMSLDCHYIQSTINRSPIYVSFPIYLLHSSLIQFQLSSRGYSAKTWKTILQR